MSDATRRGIRTAVDGILSILVSCVAVLGIPGLNDQFDKLGLGSALAIFSLIVIILLTFFTTLKNKLEDNNTIPALLKAPASPGANPVPDPKTVFHSAAKQDLTAEEEFIANTPGAAANPYESEQFDGKQDV